MVGGGFCLNIAKLVDTVKLHLVAKPLMKECVFWKACVTSAGCNKAWVHVCACGPSEVAGKENHWQSTSFQCKLPLLLPVRMLSVMLLSPVSLPRASLAIPLTLGTKEPQGFDTRLHWKHILLLWDRLQSPCYPPKQSISICNTNILFFKCSIFLQKFGVVDRFMPE